MFIASSAPQYSSASRFAAWCRWRSLSGEVRDVYATEAFPPLAEGLR
jgi:hypothetical protein